MEGLIYLNFDEVLSSYREEFLQDLNTLLSIKSVSALGTDEPAKALEWMLSRAEQFGLKTRNYDNMAGHAEYGDGETICGVLTHLDVVPAERSDWTCEPFALTVKNGRLYGRGVADDKGSALAALYCLRALKECHIKGNRVRVIFGTSEEIGMEDMSHYFKYEPVPDMSFTPDSDYGICAAEKGILQLEISSSSWEDSAVRRLEAGTADNVVPDSAYALLECFGEEEETLSDIINKCGGSFELHRTTQGIKLISKGKAAHACEPEKGYNAAAALICALNSAFGRNRLGSLCRILGNAVGMETNGNSMGLKMRDSASGALTLTLSRLYSEGDKMTAVLDIRYPVTFRGENIVKQIRKVTSHEGLDVKIRHHQPPLCIDENAPIVQILKTAYTAVTGEPPTMYKTGGGTYARTLGGKGVAFGPVFEGDDSRMHNTDESLDEENFFRHFRICLEAMYGMMTADNSESCSGQR